MLLLKFQILADKNLISDLVIFWIQLLFLAISCLELSKDRYEIENVTTNDELFLYCVKVATPQYSFFVSDHDELLRNRVTYPTNVPNLRVVLDKKLENLNISEITDARLLKYFISSDYFAEKLHEFNDVALFD